MSAWIDCIIGCDHPNCYNESQRGFEFPQHGTMMEAVEDTRDMGLWEPRAWMHITKYDLDLCYRHWPKGWTQELVAYMSEKQVTR